VKELVFAVPGDLATPTGGYAYDRRVIAELEALAGGCMCSISAKAFRSQAMRRAARRAPSGYGIAGAMIIVDGLAFGVLADIANRFARRIVFIAFVLIHSRWKSV